MSIELRELRTTVAASLCWVAALKFPNVRRRREYLLRENLPYREPYLLRVEYHDENAIS